MDDLNSFVQTILTEYLQDKGVVPDSEEWSLVMTALGLLQSSSLMQTATITLSATQIKNLKASPVPFLPAPGAGKAYLFFSAFWQYKRGTTAFTLLNDDGSIIIAYNGITPVPVSSGGMNVDDAITANGYPDASSVGLNPNVTFGGGLASGLINNAPILIANLDANEYASGDGTITITVYYTVINLS